MFNDTFDLLNASVLNATAATHGVSLAEQGWDGPSLHGLDARRVINVTMSETGIAWATDKDKFKNPPEYPELCNNDALCLYQMYPGVISKEEGVQSEHFMVWMRLSAMPRFRKLYGRIDEDIPAGSTVLIRVHSRYPVQTFGGSKALMISSTSWTGANMLGFGIIYMVSGA